MENKFAALTFTESVKRMQEQFGTRRQNERLEAYDRFPTGLTEAEVEFIGERDGFYLATVGENGQPYVQFRGGPAGFLKVLDAHTLGYADFRGNQQLISMGNLAHNNRAALILMDYANRQRLKILARLEVTDVRGTPELAEKLAVPGYQARVERAVVLHVEAMDWNCPQHITPRYTVAEIKEMVAPIYEQVEKLEAENQRLREQLASAGQ